MVPSGMQISSKFENEMGKCTCFTGSPRWSYKGLEVKINIKLRKEKGYLHDGPKSPGRSLLEVALISADDRDSQPFYMGVHNLEK